MVQSPNTFFNIKKDLLLSLHPKKRTLSLTQHSHLSSFTAAAAAAADHGFCFLLLMADDMADFGFWLPSDFLADDILPGKDTSDGVGGGGGEMWFPNEFAYGGSDMGSPEESVLGSTEAESDEEELEVARRSATKVRQNQSTR